MTCKADLPLCCRESSAAWTRLLRYLLVGGTLSPALVQSEKSVTARELPANGKFNVCGSMSSLPHAKRPVFRSNRTLCQRLGCERGCRLRGQTVASLSQVDGLPLR